MEIYRFKFLTEYQELNDFVYKVLFLGYNMLFLAYFSLPYSIAPFKNLNKQRC